MLSAAQKLGFQPRTFKLKVAESTFNDETRVKKSIISSAPMDFVKENKVRILPALRPARLSLVHSALGKTSSGAGFPPCCLLASISSRAPGACAVGLYAELRHDRACCR